MLRIKLVFAVVNAIVGVLMARDVLWSVQEIEAYESWQGSLVDE